MTPSSNDKMGSQRLRREWIPLGAALLLIFPALPAQATPIRHQSVTHPALPRDLHAWVNFLGGGESLWARKHAPPVTAHVRQLIAQELSTTNPASTLMVQYLTWRRDLNPQRFDRWHPTLGPELQNL